MRNGIRGTALALTVAVTVLGLSLSVWAGPILYRVLDNGLTVIIKEDHKAPVAISNVWFRVGSNYETPEVYGWSHGIEHMLFKGTKRRGPGDVSREVKEAGGTLNAGTGHETTNYYIVLPARNLDVAIDIHSDALLSSSFDQEALDNEREVLIEENNMRQDIHTGPGHTWDDLMEIAFTEAAYRRSIGGPNENLRNCRRRTILGYRDTYYVPGNCAVVIAGDIDTEDILARIEDAYGSWEGDPPPPRPTPVEPPQEEFRYRTGTGDVEQVYLKLGYHSHGELHPETFAIKVLVQMLGRGQSSRLVQEVREKRGLVSEIDILEETGPDMGYFLIDAVTDIENLEAAQEAILVELERIKHEPFSVEEMEKAKTAIERDYALMNETVDDQAGNLGYFWAMGDYTVADTYVERVRQVTPEMVVEAARHYFDLDQCSVNVFYPEGAVGTVETDGEAVYVRLAGSVSRVREEVLVRLAAREEAPSLRRDVLANGVTVITHRLEGSPVTSLGAFVRGGSYFEDAENNGVTGFMQRVMVKGTATRTARELAEGMEALGGEIDPFNSYDVAGCFVTVLPRNLAPAWRILAEIITQPSFPAEEIERERELILAELTAQEDNSIQKTVVEFAAAVFGGHPYGLPALGSREVVSSLQRRDLEDWYRRSYVSGNLVISMVGDFDREAALSLIEDGLASMPAGERAEAEVGEVPSLKGREQRVLEKAVAQDVIITGFPGPAAGHKDRYAMEVLQNVLTGMGNRLFVELRDKRSLCYFTGLFYRPMREAGLLGAYIGTSPDKEGDAVEGILDELRKVVEDRVTTEELERSQNTIVGNFAVDYQTTGALASFYAQNELLGLGYEWGGAYPDRIMAVTRNDVRRVARDYFDLENIALVVTKPAGGAE